MVQKDNPQVSSFIEYGALDSEFELNFKDLGITFAFTIEDYEDNELKYDPRYVKGFARLVTLESNVETETLIEYRTCTEKDFNLFPEPMVDSLTQFKLYKEGQKTLFCLDWEKHGDEFAIWGHENDH